MAYELNFDIKTSGADSIDKIAAIISAIGKESGAANYILKILEETFRKDAAAGRTLEATLRDVAKWSKDFGTEVAGSARNILEQAAAARKAQADIQALGKAYEAAAARMSAARHAPRPIFSDLALSKRARKPKMPSAKLRQMRQTRT